MSTKKLKCLTQCDKLKIIRAHEDGKSRREILNEFGLASSSFYQIIRFKEAIKQYCMQGKGSIKRNRSVVYPNIERCILKWISEKVEHGVPLDGTVVKAQAKIFAIKLGIDDFSASNGWLNGFKKRHRLKFSQITWLEQNGDWRTTAQLDEYKASDIYIAVETGLLYRCSPDQTSSLRYRAIGEQTLGQERVAVLLCANVIGTEKFPLTVVGKMESSEHLRGIGTSTLPVEYEHNEEARKQEIAYFFKRCYRKELVTHLLTCQRNEHDPNVNLTEALGFAARAWQSVSGDSIKRANFRLYALCAGLSKPIADNVEEEEEHVWPSVNDWYALTPSNPKPTFSEYVRVDEALIVHGSLSDDEIVGMVVHLKEQLEESVRSKPELLYEELHERPVKKSSYVAQHEAKKAVQTLQAFFEQRHDTPSRMFYILHELDECVRDVKPES
uniref:HTH CENPB-type domain-containing protein n=1 Tax=Anopheles dirus TaxID=7168 RepID=A0A182N5Y4_9DIPT